MAILGTRRPALRLAVPALRGAYQLANAATALAAIDLLRDRLHVRAGAVRDGLIAVEPQRTIPGAARTADDRARRRAQSARGARGGDDARVDGPLSADDRRVRHARRQGHRRRDRRDERADRPLARRDTSGSARRERRRAVAARSRTPASRRMRRSIFEDVGPAFAAARYRRE